MPDLLASLLGLALILVVAADIFRSLLVPHTGTRALRLGPLLMMGLFPAWERASRRIRGRRVRQAMRAILAPLLLALALMIWAGLLILGFGLLFWAERASFPVRFAGVGDAVYAAGSAFATLDVEDAVRGVPARLVVVCCALAGLATVTVVATFLISVQAAFGAREVLVLRLEAHVTLPPAGVAILETYAREGIVGRLGAFFDDWERWAAEVAISHRAYPILLFFRSSDPRCEWLAALGAVMDAAALLDATVEGAPDGARAAGHFVQRTALRAVCELARLSAPGEHLPEPPVDEARFDAHRARLAEAGYRLAADRDAALAAYRARRAGYGPALATLGRRLAIALDERHADERDSRPRGLAGPPGSDAAGKGAADGAGAQ